MQEELVLSFRMPSVENPGNYLSVPTIWGRSKRAALAYVNDRVLAKVQGWKHWFLSQAGIEVLIKSVAHVVPAYPMNVFLFPDSICNDIDAAIARFCWG
ncbi:hypothetical protein ACFX14_018565 [Malus domestica]